MSATVRITLLYAIFGIAWILFSDTAVSVLFGASPEVFAYVQSIKGIFYVVITSLLLFLLIQNENRLREKREADFRLLFTNNPHPMGVYDRDTMQFIEVNAIAVQVYGYTRDEFLSMTIKDIYPSEDVDALLKRLEQGHHTFGTFRETRHQLKSGDIIHVDVNAREMKYQSYNAVFVSAIDVSERVQLENERMKNQALHAALNKEIDARANRDRLASMVSHDLRTPLATIMSSASMLERYDDRYDSEQRVNHYQKILRQTRQLNDEFEDILLWLRSEGDTSAFQPVKTNMVEFIEPILAEFAIPAYPERLQFHHSGERIIAEIDVHLFHRVVSNLVSNACKYSPDDSPVEVILLSDNDGLELIVKDSGIGIPQDNFEHLFDAFYRADNVVNMSGTGLGLSIVKEIVELHNGLITVDSQEGQGSTFTVKIPSSQPIL